MHISDTTVHIRWLTLSLTTLLHPVSAKCLDGRHHRGTGSSGYLGQQSRCLQSHRSQIGTTWAPLTRWKSDDGNQRIWLKEVGLGSLVHAFQYAVNQTPFVKYAGTPTLYDASSCQQRRTKCRSRDGGPPSRRAQGISTHSVCSSIW
jgi:hypothetical protein